MLVTREVGIYDGDELVGVDYVADSLLRPNSRVVPHDDRTPGQRRRALQIKAMADLKGLGWKNRDIAEAFNFTERHVERRRQLFRKLQDQVARRSRV
jgi:Homeodomain-like domain